MVLGSIHTAGYKMTSVLQLGKGILMLYIEFYTTLNNNLQNVLTSVHKFPRKKNNDKLEFHITR
jgi:hypothetical protein